MRPTHVSFGAVAAAGRRAGAVVDDSADIGRAGEHTVSCDCWAAETAGRPGLPRSTRPAMTTAATSRR